MEGYSTESRDAEARRLGRLAEYPLDDESLGSALDRCARFAARLCDAPIALVSLVEEHEQRFVGRHGTDVGETPRDWSFCAHAMHGGDAMIVTDASLDPRFADNPLVTGAPGIRFYAGQPLRSAEGEPLGSFCVIDTNPREGLNEDQRECLATLAIAAMALLERWRVEQRSRHAEQRSQSRIADLAQRFQVLTDAMPQLVWATPPDGQIDYLNRGWCEFTGHPPEASYGSQWLGFVHPEDREQARANWAEAVATGQSYEVEYRLRQHAGEYRWVLARGLPMRDAAGSVTRWIGTCTDVHAQQQAAERLDLLTRELSHRIKNIFAVIGGLISLTVRRRPEFAEVGGQLQDRVLALGRAHDYVRPHSERSQSPRPHTSLQGMLRALLAPYREHSAELIGITGIDVTIDDRSATALALFFHELATNAAKYGALSAEAGQVQIEIADDEPGEITLTWCETGGPPVSLPDARGFGTTLIEMSVGRQLGGTIDYQWRRQGLWLRARVPAEMMTR